LRWSPKTLPNRLSSYSITRKSMDDKSMSKLPENPRRERKARDRIDLPVSHENHENHENPESLERNLRPLREIKARNLDDPEPTDEETDLDQIPNLRTSKISQSSRELPESLYSPENLDSPE